MTEWQPECDDCGDSGIMYMSDDCYGECIHCDVFDKNKPIEQIRKERDYYCEKASKLEEELRKLTKQVYGEEWFDKYIEILTQILEQSSHPDDEDFQRVEGSHVDRPGDINEDGAKLCDTCREEVHWSDDGQTELCPCNSNT